MDKDTFLEKVVFGYIKEDLITMQTKKNISGVYGNINFPLALCTLVDMNYLGGFLLGGECTLNEHIKVYIQRCFKNPKEYPARILADIFRSGLIHDFFARGAICRKDEHPALFRNEKNDAVLDADTLVNDFLASLNRFKKELSEKNYKSRMEECEKNFRKKLNKHSELIDKLPERHTDLTFGNNTSSPPWL